jgi:hypothetical protein
MTRKTTAKLLHGNTDGNNLQISRGWHLDFAQDLASRHFSIVEILNVWSWPAAPTPYRRDERLSTRMPSRSHRTEVHSVMHSRGPKPPSRAGWVHEIKSCAAMVVSYASSPSGSRSLRRDQLYERGAVLHLRCS